LAGKPHRRIGTVGEDGTLRKQTGIAVRWFLQIISTGGERDISQREYAGIIDSVIATVTAAPLAATRRR
jgi:hypothetical protein